MSVVKFPGTTAHDIPVSDVLEGAEGAESVIVVSVEGSRIEVASSSGDICETIVQLEIAVEKLRRIYAEAVEAE